MDIEKVFDEAMKRGEFGDMTDRAKLAICKGAFETMVDCRKMAELVAIRVFTTKISGEDLREKFTSVELCALETLEIARSVLKVIWDQK